MVSHSADIRWVPAEGVAHEDEVEWSNMVLANSTVTTERLMTCFLQTVCRAG